MTADPRGSTTFVRGPAGPLHVTDGGEGDGVPVLFLHGLGGTLDTWTEQLAHLRATRRAVAFEARGHGESGRADRSVYTIDGWTDDLEAIVDALCLGPAVLVGHSLAGAVMQLFAVRRPEAVAGLVFADAIGDFRRVAPLEAIEAWLAEDASRDGDAAAQQAVFAEMLGPRARPSTRARTLSSLSRLDPAAWVPMRRSIARFVPPGGLEGLPLLAIEAADARSPLLFSALVPSAPRRLLARASHWLMLDDPEGFDAALDDFLRGVDARAANAPVDPTQ